MVAQKDFMYPHQPLPKSDKGKSSRSGAIRSRNVFPLYGNSKRNKRKIGKARPARPKADKYKATPGDIERKISLRKQV